VAINQIAAAAARQQSAKVELWIAWLAKATLVIGVGLSVFAWLVLPPFASFAFDSAVVGRCGAWLACTPLLELPRVALTAALQGTRRMTSLARIENGQELARVFLVICGALATGTAMGPVLGTLGASAVGSLLAIDLYRRECRQPGSDLPPLRAWLARIGSVPLTYGLRLGLRVGVVRNLDVYAVQILPSMLLGYFGDAAWVAYMRLAQRFVGLARTFMAGINRTALPYFSQLRSTQSVERLERAYWRATLFSGLVVSGGLLLSIPLAPLLIGLFPRDFHGPVLLCYWILVPGAMVVAFSVANDVFYMVTNTLGVAIKLQVVCMVITTTTVAACAATWPTFGTAIGLSICYCCSAVHVGYAALWFRRNARG